MFISKCELQSLHDRIQRLEVHVRDLEEKTKVVAYWPEGDAWHVPINQLVKAIVQKMGMQPKYVGSKPAGVVLEKK